MNTNIAKIIVPIFIILVALTGLGIFLSKEKPREAVKPIATNFEECVSMGNPVMESFPRQCNANGVTYTEKIDGVTNVEDMIKVTTPLPNSNIKNPLVIKGEARGGWFFEATFPVVLTNWDGVIIAEGYGTAEGEWMSENFVPFTATLNFTKPDFNNRGFLILKKANASGLSENDAALEIPIYFEGVPPQNSSPEQVFCTMDAKVCPDGTYVGRQGPTCEFAPCPGN